MICLGGGYDPAKIWREVQEIEAKQKKEPWGMTPEEYKKAIEWTKIEALPADAQECHSYQGPETMYYSKETGRRYTFFQGVYRQSRTKEEIGFEPFKQEIHIKRHEVKGKLIPGPKGHYTCVDCNTNYPELEFWDARSETFQKGIRCNGHTITLCPWCRPDSAPWKNGRGI